MWTPAKRQAYVRKWKKQNPHYSRDYMRKRRISAKYKAHERAMEKIRNGLRGGWLKPEHYLAEVWDITKARVIFRGTGKRG